MRKRTRSYFAGLARVLVRSKEGRQRRDLQDWLRRLVDALNNHFGNCCDCGGAIPVERLHADVGAPFCAYCQEEIDERRERA